jgi:hypothetical protein
MKKLTLITLLFCAFTAKAQNLILNGSFELNNLTQCYDDLTSIYWNNTVDYTTSFGYTIVLHKDSCLRCSPPTFWGGGAAEGNWMSALVSKPFNLPAGEIWAQSKLSFDLNYPLDNEKNYKLSFYIKEPPDIPLNSTGCLESPSNFIHIGISNSPTSFGTHIYSSPLGDSIWKLYSMVFNTQNSEGYITVEIDTGNISQYGVFIDNFVLVETEEQPNAIFELNNNTKQLLKIVDVLGRESKPNSNTPLFYIYSDGAVEKRIVVE